MTASEYYIYGLVIIWALAIVGLILTRPKDK